MMHSLTKYCNGHSDVIMGAAVTNCVVKYEKLKFLQNGERISRARGISFGVRPTWRERMLIWAFEIFSACGVVPSPFDCYLVLRSLKTLKVRMDQHMESSLQIAEFLEKSPFVEKVLHPGDCVLESIIIICEERGQRVLRPPCRVTSGERREVL